MRSRSVSYAPPRADTHSGTRGNIQCAVGQGNIRWLHVKNRANVFLIHTLSERWALSFVE